MEIRFNLTGADRKNLVTAVSEAVDCEAVYMKAPSFAYKVGGCTIDKNGTLVFDEPVDRESVRILLEDLAERGFTSEDTLEAEEPVSEAHAGDVIDRAAPVVDVKTEEESGRLAIDLPLGGFSATALDNLEKLVASKAALIGRAIGVSELPIIRGNERLSFPWFESDAKTEEVEAYTVFIHALCEMAKKQKRVTAKEKPADSEKFAFRCFLLRLGFIGDEYAAARKVLLRNLSGSGSFKSDKPKDQAEAATVGATAADSGAESDSGGVADKEESGAYSA